MGRAKRAGQYQVGAWLGAAHDAELLLRLAGLLWRFWGTRGYLGEGRAWTQAALAAASDRADLVAAKAQVLEGAGLLAFRQIDYAQARAVSHASLGLYRSREDVAGMASVLNALGLVAPRLFAATDTLRSALVSSPLCAPRRHGVCRRLGGWAGDNVAAGVRVC